MKPLQISTSKQSIAGQQLIIKASTKHEENPH